MRNAGGKRQAAKFNLNAIKTGAAVDPALQAGDMIVAGESAIKKGFNNVLKAQPIAGLFAFL
jgi:polysaccharide export outer membrane protein